ncbi:MAG: AAA family ATPase [Oscillospiraceae bacterium]|nr:AAA family ATPase [Oscillospiraceae bacterium]
MIIAVASGKGGTGKTTSVAAISSCLAVLGHKTLCIDFDTGLGNLDLALDMTDFSVMDFRDVLTGGVDLMSACSESPEIPNLFYLSAPTDRQPEETDREAIVEMFKKIRSTFEYCIIDAPPGIGTGFELAHADVDMSIIITTGELPSIRDAARAAGVLRDMEIENIRLIVNRVSRTKFKQIKTTIDDVIDSTGVQLLGIIAEDKNIFLALHEGVPLVLYNKRKAAYDFLDIALRIKGEEVPLQQG